MGFRLTSGALQLVMSFLSRWVRRKTLLGLGMVWQCIANYFVSLSHTYENILVGRIMSGVGASPQHPIGTSYIAEISSRNRIGRALGTNLAAAHIGSFMAPFVGSFLLAALGWRTTILIFSIPGVVVGVGFLLMSQSARSDEHSERSSISAMFLEAVMAFRVGANDFLPSYFVDNLGMTLFESGLVFAIFVLSGVPSPYLLGFLSDRFGRRKTVILVNGCDGRSMVSSSVCNAHNSASGRSTTDWIPESERWWSHSSVCGRLDPCERS